MATGNVGAVSGTTHDSLKQMFETALEELSGEKRLLVKSNTPIFQRKPNPQMASGEPVSTERALDDAANALAALWQTPKSKQLLRAKR